ncbi:Fc.00g111110.m01.CDS01 [Cosmosporella sp. VM-42]
MAPDKLEPNDPRVIHDKAQLLSGTYNYMIGEPEGRPIANMMLIHGFPDLGFGWRYQVPYFMSLGFRVIVPDMLGYGDTDAPDAPEAYTLKKLSADIKTLAVRTCGVKGRIILGGHDWGGALVWRTAMWYPELIQGVFSVCTPFHAPSLAWISLEDIIASGHLTNFGYQTQLKGTEVETQIQGKEKVRQFLNGMYGGRSPAGEFGFSTQKGILFDTLPHLKKSPLLSEQDLDFYTEQYCIHGPPELRGPLNWYRTRHLNFEDELPLAENATKEGRQFLKMPALFITATDDAALPPSMSAGMDKFFANLTRGEVKASHWALTQAADDVNQHVAKWANEVLGGTLKSSL